MIFLEKYLHKFDNSMDYYESLLDLYDTEYLDIPDLIEDLIDLVDEEDIISLRVLIIDMRDILGRVIEFCRVLVQIVDVNIQNATQLVELYDYKYMKFHEIIEELEESIYEQDDNKMSEIVLSIRLSLHNDIAFCSKLEDQENQ